MAYSIPSQLLRVLYTSVFSVFAVWNIFDIILFWKQTQGHRVAAVLLSVLVVVIIACASRMQAKTILLLTIVSLCVLGAKHVHVIVPDVFEHTVLWRYLLWGEMSEPRFRFAWGAVQIAVLSVALAPVCVAASWRVSEYLKRVRKVRTKIKTDSKHVAAPQNEIRHFRFACGAVLALTAYSSALAFLYHQSFLSTAFDFALFDQALFQLSRFSAPVSTIRQTTSLFFDHQHFAIAALAPLYLWFRGMHGLLLSALSPILLIAVPSIVFGYAVRELTGKTAAWAVLLSGVMLWLHPFTQASVQFYVHEKYLVPVWLSIVVYLLARFVRRRQKKALWIAGGIVMLWALTKEDQWIFIVAGCVQLAIHVLLWTRDRALRKNLLLWSGVIIAIMFGYAFMLNIFFRTSESHYSGFYTVARTAAVELVHTGNVLQFIQTIDGFSDARLYLYQHFFSIDILGSAGLPLNIFGQYAERIFAVPEAGDTRTIAFAGNLQSPRYHYGADVPVYVALGCLIVVCVLGRPGCSLREKKELSEQERINCVDGARLYTRASVAIAYITIVMIISLGYVSGWNETYYIHTTPGRIITAFLDAHERRVAVSQARELIPHDASLVAAEGYISHFSSRNQIALWPDPLLLPAHTSGAVDLLSYAYWLLPPEAFLAQDTADYQLQISFLLTQGYTIVSQNEYVVLLRASQE